MNWIEVAPDTFVGQKKYSAPLNLETIFEKIKIEFLMLQTYWFISSTFPFLGFFLDFIKKI